MTNPTPGTNRHKDSEAGPFTNLTLSYCPSFDQALKAAEPALRTVTRQNLEMARFTAQRGRSWVALWAELSACKSPVDVAKAQLKFWHTASLQYSEAAHRLWHVWATPGASSLSDEEAQAQRPHDFIEVRQPVEAKRAAA